MRGSGILDYKVELKNLNAPDATLKLLFFTFYSFEFPNNIMKNVGREAFSLLKEEASFYFQFPMLILVWMELWNG